MELCTLCGAPAECSHHLIFGTGLRKLAEADNLKIPLCNSCHNMAQRLTDQIHENTTAERLSKVLGQTIWEAEYIAKQLTADDEQIERAGEEAREQFRKRYGRSYK